MPKGQAVIARYYSEDFSHFEKNLKKKKKKKKNFLSAFA